MKMILQFRNFVLLAVFSIAMSFGAGAAPLAITSPVGAESWLGGSPHAITWTGDDVVNPVTIELWKGVIQVGSALTVAGSGGTFPWIISNNLVAGADYTIKLTQNFITSESAPFTITPQTITVTTPNTAVSWVRGETYSINWTDDVTGTMNIYVNNNGAYTLLTTVADGITTYSWPIPVGQATGALYKIKVASVDYPTVLDESDVNFNIIAQSIDVVTPNFPGIRWTLSSLDNVISWTDNVSAVKIELYNVTLASAVEIDPNETGTSFDWDINPAWTIGNHFKIKISSVTDPTIIAYSDHEFRIDAATNTYAIEVLQPAVSNLKWTSDQDYLISWTDNLVSPVKIELVNYSTNTLSTVILSTTGSTYPWHIPLGTPNGIRYKIMITSTTNNGVIGLSSEEFEITDTPSQADMIVVQPSDDGIEWLRGTSHVISWTDNIPNNNVVIKLYKDTNLNDSWDAGDFFVENISTTASGSTLVWPILNDAGTYPDGMYIIKIIYNSEWDDSDYAFSISDHTTADVIDVLQPDVLNIHWYRNVPYLISWNDNIPGSVDVVYYRTDDNTGAGGDATHGNNDVEYTITSNYSGGTTLVYTFPVNDVTTPESTHYIVKVYNHADHTANSGFSANEFSLTDYTYGGAITVLQPNGGETWTKGSSYIISWDDNISENVRIDAVNNATGITREIVASISGSTKVWTIPNDANYPAGIQYQIKITSIETGTITDLSNANFTIVDPATAPVVYPNPATDMVNIQVNNPTEEQYTVTFTNRFNMEVLNRSYSNSQELHISTVGIPSGIYFVTVASKTAVTTHKVIIQH